jgi:response regulator RpfG family c-di-GMP phosphodiesterase
VPTPPGSSQALSSAATWPGDSTLFASMKILIIDDEPANVALLEALLAANGYTRF